MILIVILSVLPLIFLFGASRRAETVSVAHPLQIMGWVFLLGFSLKSLYLAYAIDAGLPFKTKYLTEEFIYLGQLIVLVGVVSMIAGYFFLNKKRSFKATKVKHLGVLAGPVYWFIFILSLIGVVLFFFTRDFHLELLSLQFTGKKFYVSEGTGVRSALGFLLIGADLLVVYFLYYLVFSRKVKISSVYVLVALFVALNFFMASQRMGVIIIAIGAILVAKDSLFDISNAKVRKRILVIGITFSLLSVASIIRDSRNEVSASNLSIVGGVEATLGHVFQGLYAVDPEKVTGIALNNDEYFYGRTFLMFMVAPIPRVLWPDKPNVRLGPYVTQDILRLNTQSGAPPSAIGEFYINFGWAGVVFGMFICGVILSLLQKRVAYFGSSDLARIRYALGIMLMIYFMIGDFSYAVLFLFKYGLASYVCQSYWVKKSVR